MVTGREERGQVAKHWEWGLGRLWTRTWSPLYLENTSAAWVFGCVRLKGKSSTALILALLTAPKDRPILASLTQREHPTSPS